MPADGQGWNREVIWVCLTCTVPTQNAEKNTSWQGHFLQFQHSVSPPGLPALAQDSPFTQTSSLERLQLTWSAICWTSGVAGWVSDKPPVMTGNISETMGASEEGSPEQSEKSHQAPRIYTQKHVSWDHMTFNIWNLPLPKWRRRKMLRTGAKSHVKH